MNRRRKVDLHEARAEAIETRLWQCRSCDTMIEDRMDDAPYCRSCGAYWRDVDNGLFDDEWLAHGQQAGKK